MSTPSQPTGTPPGNYQPGIPFGGTLTAPPQPDETFFPLRLDQFLSLRDGEMSVARSTRDICTGVFVTGIAGLASIFAPLDDWRKCPMVWTLLLLVLVVSAAAVGGIEQFRIRQTRGESAYARLVQTISQYFGI
jgi:hypothetical protein